MNKIFNNIAEFVVRLPRRESNFAANFNKWFLVWCVVWTLVDGSMLVYTTTHGMPYGIWVANLANLAIQVVYGAIALTNYRMTKDL